MGQWGRGEVTGRWTKPYSEERVFLREYYEVNKMKENGYEKARRTHRGEAKRIKILVGNTK